MNLKRKLILFFILAIVVSGMMILLPGNAAMILLYDRFVYYPLQNFRGLIFGRLSFSLGDLLYFSAGLYAVILLFKKAYLTIKFRKHKHRVAAFFISLINAILLIYFIFQLGWGYNYYKPSLPEQWGITTENTYIQDSSDIVALNTFLLEKLNLYAISYKPASLREINERAVFYYRNYTDTKTGHYGLQIKPAIFSYFMERTAIEGYYNPFTGEGQVDDRLPQFMLPFVVCHEMAHQAGIAAEGDANLMAYALATAGNDPSFCYSGYLNLWMYSYSRLRRMDTAIAHTFKKRLNKLTAAHIDTLRQLSLKYQNKISKYSSDLYDSYLKMQNQEEGIRSYGNVAQSAWQFERKRAKEPGKVLHIN